MEGGRGGDLVTLYIRAEGEGEGGEGKGARGKGG
jgi:hypothetical protein